ncbi:hypothetical protein J19TS1_41580 [Heyndrickxia oleronia]|nr:hypothetical protein J19TS1_41580 [Heyndrickxia oleronia]
MKEVGIVTSNQTLDIIDPQLLNKADHVVTLCGFASDKCPVTPTKVKRIHWGFDDPEKAKGTEEGNLSVFNRV